MLIVHGFGASIGHFRRNIPELAQTHKVRKPAAISLATRTDSHTPLKQASWLTHCHGLFQLSVHTTAWQVAVQALEQLLRETDQ